MVGREFPRGVVSRSPQVFAVLHLVWDFHHVRSHRCVMAAAASLQDFPWVELPLGRRPMARFGGSSTFRPVFSLGIAGDKVESYHNINDIITSIDIY